MRTKKILTYDRRRLFERDSEPDTVGAKIKAFLEKGGWEINLLIIIAGLQPKVHALVYRHGIGKTNASSKSAVQIAK